MKTERRWRPIRQALAADLVNDTLALVSTFRRCISMMPTRDEHIFGREMRFKRIMSAAIDSCKFLHEDDVVEIYFPDTYESVPLESPKKLLYAYQQVVAQILIDVKNYERRVEYRITRYGFCLSPEIIEIIPDSPDKLGGQGRRPQKRWANCRFLLSPVGSVRIPPSDPS